MVQYINPRLEILYISQVFQIILSMQMNFKLDKTLQEILIKPCHKHFTIYPTFKTVNLKSSDLSFQQICFDYVSRKNLYHESTVCAWMDFFHFLCEIYQS